MIHIDHGCVVDVHEAHCSKRNGDWVRWINRMNEAAIIRFTGNSPFPGPHPIQIEVGSHHQTNPVIAAEGSYEYTVACAGAF